MDLSELLPSNSIESRRHPWEIARVRSLARIVHEQFVYIDSVLDIGCGDGFTGLELFKRFAANRYVGYDRFLTVEQRDTWSSLERGIRFAQELPDPSHRSDLVLLCDVIEHVEDDVALLRDAWSRVAEGGLLVVTVPAFQSLFSSQDRALRHFRRYASSSLRRTFREAGIPPIRFGYLFGTLLLPRVLAVLYEGLRGQVSSESAEFGIGAWQGSSRVTRLLGEALDIDNRLLLGLSRFGIRIPGLSAWVVVKKQTEQAQSV